MKILVLNSGSSSIKYQLFDMRDGSTRVHGIVERIGEAPDAGGELDGDADRDADGDADGDAGGNLDELPPDHHAAMDRIVDRLGRAGLVSDGSDLLAIGHRVVHGGERFSGPTRIDAEVLEAIRQLSPLAPLHNPANVTGIEVAMQRFPDVPQVAVFDTAFHQSLPPWAYHYAVPRELYERFGVRRYGFHGTSHDYVSQRAAEHLGRDREQLNLITLHLGNGASAAAIRGGRCVDTSMGLTPLEGLVMGTRCGDLDPAVVFHVARQSGWSIDRLDSLLNKDSGLKGICGVNDMRDVLRHAAHDDPLAELAIDIYCYRLRKYIGAYWAALGRLDAVVFTAGIGENSAEIRLRACQGLEPLGLHLDPARNAQAGDSARTIQAPDSRVAVLVVPTNEELEIARQTHRVVQSGR